MNFASRIDLFTQSLTLNVKGEKDHKTEIGGFCTLLAVVLIIAQSINFLMMLVNQDITMAG